MDSFLPGKLLEVLDKGCLLQKPREHPLCKAPRQFLPTLKCYWQNKHGI